MQSLKSSCNSVLRLIAAWLILVASASAADPAFQVKPLSAEQIAEYKLNASFYKKCTLVQGILIVTSENVGDVVHHEAAYLFDKVMTGIKPQIARRIRDKKVLCVLVGHAELVSDLPQFATDKTGKEKDFYNWRNRGSLTTQDGHPTVLFAEEDVMEYEGGMQLESILIHEFGHVIDGAGFDDDLQARLAKAFEHAKATGIYNDGYAAQKFRRVTGNTPVSLLDSLTKAFPAEAPGFLKACLDGGDILVNGKPADSAVKVTGDDKVLIVFGGPKQCYAGLNHAEYWAEGVQDWFDTNRTMDHDHNRIHTRAQLKEYDPELSKLCAEVLGDSAWVFTSPRTRAGTGHLAGYDPATAPKMTKLECIDLAAQDYYDVYWKDYWQRLHEKHGMLNPPEVWNTCDPDAGPLDEKVIRRWTTKAATYKEVYFSAIINGQTVRVYGIYAAPLKPNKDGADGPNDGPGAKMPAVMHLHGGGQTVDERWLEAWAARGYAALTCNYHGVWEDRDLFTHFPETLKQGNHKHCADKEMATVPSVRESSWYIWSAIARRSLTYLRQQPEVDRERIGAFGVSMGGTTIWSFAMDPRLKAACAIYGCGWNRYYRHIPRFDPSVTLPEMTRDDRVWLAGMAPEACAPFVKCPMLFLSSSNDTHGNMDRAYETLARLPESVEHRQSFTPRFCHHVGADSGQNLFLWMDTWLKGGPSWPKDPVAKISLDSNNEAVAAVTVDRPDDVEKIAIYYAVANPRPMSRNWRNATATRTAGGWQAKLPVLDTGAYLFAFANVRYKTGVALSSNEDAVIPSSLGAARATDAVSNVLYDGADGSGMWATNSPCVDPVPPEDIPVPVRPATGPDGKAGFTVDYYLAPMTYQPGDPKWRAPDGAGLSFQVATARGESFTVNLYEDYAWPGQKTYEAQVSLKGQAGWQSLTLLPADFHEKTSGVTTGPAPTTFSHCQVLELAGTWKDKNIVFTDFRWVKK